MATYHVTPTGSDSNAGANAYDDSFLTIAYAVAQTSAGAGYGGGDTIKVYPSASGLATYYENSTISFRTGLKTGTTLEAITSSYSANTNNNANHYPAIIDFTSNTSEYSINMWQFVIIKGFRVTGSSTRTISAEGSTDGPIQVLDCFFDNCSGTNVDHDVIRAPGSTGATQSTIARCIFQQCHRPVRSHGVAAMAIQSCLAYDCTSSRSTFDAAKGIIEHCTAVRCKVYGGTNQHILSTPTTLADAYIRNSIVANCWTKGWLIYGSTNQEIRNCIAYTNDYDADNTFGTGNADTTALNSFETDPKFKKFADSDFRIKCSSPAKLAGVSGEHAASASHGLVEAATGALNYIHKITAFASPPNIGAFSLCLGYSHNILGVDADSIGKFINVDSADILKAIGVE